MTRRIFLVEDEGNLIEQARQELELIYDKSSVQIPDGKGKFRTTMEFGRRYDFLQAELPQTNNGLYWRGLEIGREDLIVLDLNFKNYINPITREKTHLSFSGKEVLRVLEQEKKIAQLPGLERVLIATSMRAEVDPKQVSPDIALVDGFNVYGLEKAVGPNGQIIGYGRSLAEKIHQIYEGIKGEPLSYLNK